MIYFKEILIASLGLLLVPKNVEITISDLVGKTKFLPESSGRMLEEKEDTIFKLNSVSETISEVSKSYQEVAATAVEENILQEELIDEILVNMEGMSTNILYEDIVSTENGILDDILKCLTEKNIFNIQDLIDIFENHNSYIIGIEEPKIQNDITQVVKMINQTFKLNKINSAWKQKVDESKLAMSTQLEGVSKVIRDVAKDLDERKESYHFEKEKEKIEILLLQKKIKIYDLKIEEKDSRIFVSLCTEVNDDITEEAKKIQKVEEILTKALQKKMKLQNQNKSNANKVLQNYISEDKYTITVGKARIAKERLNINGDSMLEQKLEDGKIALAISDGMGTGAKAQKYSGLVIHMLQKLLGAGFQKKESLELVNSTVLTLASKEEYATIDMCILDLFSGNAEFIKNGACPTFIKNEKKVEKIEATCLPAGISGKLDTVVFDKDLNDGDIIIMITDGILDANKEAIDKQQSLEEFIRQINTRQSTKNCGYSSTRGYRL